VAQGRILLHAAQCTLGAKDTHFNVEVVQDAKQQQAAVDSSSSSSTVAASANNSIVWKLKAASKSDRQLWLDAIEKAILVAKFNIDNSGVLSVDSLTTSAAAAPFNDSDSQYKSVQQSYLRRLSVSNVEALSANNGYAASANSNGYNNSFLHPQAAVAKPAPEKKPAENALRRLSRIFFNTAKEEKPKETTQAPSLVELYFREQDQIEEVRRKSLTQSGGSNANISISAGADISDFNELQKLINQADASNSIQSAAQQQHSSSSHNNNREQRQLRNGSTPSTPPVSTTQYLQGGNNNNNFDNDTSSIAENTHTNNNNTASATMVNNNGQQSNVKGQGGDASQKRRVESIDNDATENDFNSDEDDNSTTPLPTSNKARRFSRLKTSQALKQYKEDKQQQQQAQQQQAASAELPVSKHKRTNSDESENNSSSVSEGETKSDAEISISITAASQHSSNSNSNNTSPANKKRNTIYYQPNVLHDPLQEIKNQKQQKAQHAAENNLHDTSNGEHHSAATKDLNNPAAQPEKKERRKSLLFNLFGRK